MKNTTIQKQNESNADLAKRIIKAQKENRNSMNNHKIPVPNHISLRVSDEIMDFLESEQLRIASETGIMPSRSAVVNLLLNKQLGVK